MEVVRTQPQHLFGGITKMPCQQYNHYCQSGLLCSIPRPHLEQRKNQETKVVNSDLVSGIQPTYFI